MISRPSFCFLVGIVLAVAAAAGWGRAKGEPPDSNVYALLDKPAVAPNATEPRRFDPAAWGSDHVGKTYPLYVTGDECLFCHREIGATWQNNRHQLTIRPASRDDPAVKVLREHSDGEELSSETDYLIGSKRRTRYLRRSKAYGKLDLLSMSFVPAANADNTDRVVDQLKDDDSPHWDEKTFGNRCAGCHTTAVDTKTRAFSAISLDCFTCHGDVPLEHTKDISRALLSSKNRQPRQVVSTCGQCHLRGGKSKSTGLPYPNTFVAGDNLFRDFEVDFSDETIASLPAIDEHIYLSSRDVAVLGPSSTTCLTCHDVHGQSTVKHQSLEDAAICTSCHVPETDNSQLKEGVRPSNRRRYHSRICDY